MSYHHKDFKIYEETNSYGKTVWRVRSGGKRGSAVTSSYNKELAISQCDSLNRDPWFFERGQTRKDRV